MEEEVKTEEKINYANELKKSLENVIDINQIEELVNRNYSDFDYKNVKYRVKKPTFEQKQTLSVVRIKKFNELLKNDIYMFEEELIKIYKKKGVDIKELDRQVEQIDKKRNDCLFKLGLAIKDKKSESELQKYRDEIKSLFSDQQSISVKRSDYMSTSLESQLNIFAYTYLAYLATEKEIVEENSEKKWILAWSSYEQFTKEDESLINTCVYYVSLLTRLEPLNV